MKENIVFIVGVGRSGTSLLQSMFAAHPKVSSLPEISFLRRFIVSGKLQSVIDTGGESAILKFLENDQLLARTDIDYSKVFPLEGDFSNNIDVGIYRSILSLCLGNEGEWVVEKDPKLVEYLVLIKTLFPNSNIVHITRDPRDVLVSKKSAKWSKGGHVWKHIFANKVQLALGKANGPILFGSNYHEILYEDLIMSPETVLERLCNDIGLLYDGQMLSFGVAARKLVSESELSWKKETLGPLINNNNQKWKSKLTPREVKLTEMSCNEAMLAGNYEFDDQNRQLSMLDKLWVLCGRFIINIAAYPYIMHRNYNLAEKCKKVG